MAPLSVWLVPISYFALAVVSAVVPWVNAEILMLSAIPIAPTPAALAGLVVAVSAGQMTGKSAMYWLSRRSAGRRSVRLQGSIDRWHARLAGHPRSALALTFVSSLVGFPPFFIVSIAAGALEVAFGRFLAVGTAGRLLHFAAVAFAPELLRRIR